MRILWFLQLLRHFLLFLEARNNLFPFCTKFWVKRARFLVSKHTSLLLCSKQVQPNWWHFFKDFKSKCGLRGLMKLRLLVGILLMEIILGLKVAMNQVTKKNLILVVFQICDSCFNAKTTKYVYLRFFLDFLVFATSKPLLVLFRS